VLLLARGQPFASAVNTNTNQVLCTANPVQQIYLLQFQIKQKHPTQHHAA
jgi:hypothetical protein